MAEETSWDDGVFDDAFPAPDCEICNDNNAGSMQQPQAASSADAQTPSNPRAVIVAPLPAQPIPKPHHKTKADAIAHDHGA
ncbi:MAG: hypothetical protein AAFW82_01240 [Pseudomonadota bacterium]